MPTSKYPTRQQQPVTSSGPGLSFVSPIKRRDKRKSTTQFMPYTLNTKHQMLEQRLKTLLKAATPEPTTPGPQVELVEAVAEHGSQEDVEMSDLAELPGALNEEEPHPPKRIVPDKTANKLFSRWADAIPQLIDPLLHFITSTVGKIPSDTLESEISSCEHSGSCNTKTFKVLCLYLYHFKTIDVVACDCNTVLQVLVKNGLFPTAPSYPRMAISIHLLDFYHALFERSCDAVNAMASALNTFYTRRGFVMTNAKGAPVQDPFRRGLGFAVQFYDKVQRCMEERIEQAIQAADERIQSMKVNTKSSSDSTDVSIQTGECGLGECARILQQRCPACFGGISFGRSPEQGADIHVCLDGNFNHRHLRSAGECPNFYEPLYVIPKSQVDDVGERIEAVRKRPPKKYRPTVPDLAVDECEDGHTAGNGNNVKTNMEKFDDGGWMALVCRHDIPLFLANIDSPGEQQKYPVALLEHLFSLIPPVATLAVLYDVGCVLHRSLQLYDILPEQVTKRMVFATSAMHAYVHQWSCQIVYNPQIRAGFGLTDGEGVEHLWSRTRKLIGITRSSARLKRVWHFDRQVASIGADLRDDLGNWIKRRLMKGIKVHQKAAAAILSDCEVPLETLREQWNLQKAAQLSLRAHAPSRLKKELDTVLNLQGDLEVVENAIHSTHAQISTAQVPSSNSLQLLTNLEEAHDRLKDNVEALYASLNVHDSYPELQGIDLTFVRTLLMARDLKINIRKRAVGSFFEWDKLNQAMGGREQTIGTKVHQMTRRAIAKRKPALMTAIRKFNKYCSTLEELHQSQWSIPLPKPLPTQLSALRDASDIMEDVWISRSSEDVPRWLEDPDVREGIRAMLKLDRCLEEQRRLGVEADNLCRWFGRQLCAVELAMNANNESLNILLCQQHIHLLRLQSTWANPLASVSRFETHIQTASTTASSLSTSVSEQTLELTWLLPLSQFAQLTIKEEDVNSRIPDGITYVFQDDELVNVQGQKESAERVENEDDQGMDDLVNVKGKGDNCASTVDCEDGQRTLLRGVVEEADNLGRVLSECLQDDKEVDLVIGMDVDVDADVVETTEEPMDVQIIWALPDFCMQDDTLLRALDIHTFIPPSTSHARRMVHLDNRVCLTFESLELDIMSSPHARLNDGCINMIASYLQDFFSKPSNASSATSMQCAVFTTHDLLLVRYNFSDHDFWRRTRPTQYWTKSVWIVPIHRKRPFEHWVLAIIFPYKQELLVFDSLAGQSGWKSEIKELVSFAGRLAVLGVSRGGHQALQTVAPVGWIARPSLTSAKQTNGYDCGLWVLANIAAVLRGYHVSGLEEPDMSTLRSILYEIILYLPQQ